MIRKFLWTHFVKKLARTQGFLDPFKVLATIDRFAQPSEVRAPTELLRATAILHARGLINAQVIQHNLDWIWPYWIHKQFDPRSASFIPRAFSLTHINLTHRNWTALGLPGEDATPLVDPRGLVTPFMDGWSIDVWMRDETGANLLPARLPDVEQSLRMSSCFSVQTTARSNDMTLSSAALIAEESGGPVCRIQVQASSRRSADVIMALRPVNPEGISFVRDIHKLPNDPGWRVNHRHEVIFSREAEHYHFSDFRRGDVFHHLDNPDGPDHITCHSELASAAAVFPLNADKPQSLSISIPLKEKKTEKFSTTTSPKTSSWPDVLSGSTRLRIPDPHYTFLFEAAVHTLLIHTAGDVFAGPYTYKRFWFRDAVFITRALISCGFIDRAERIIGDFASRQTSAGYFESQEGEWDSNGQVLWLIEQFCRCTGRHPKEEWRRMIHRGAEWIVQKRLRDDPDVPHAGLMPSGFSAEHLGPNNFYYWDDFWSVAGLQSTAYLMSCNNDKTALRTFSDSADNLMTAVDRSLDHCAERLKSRAMPSSPYRRLDSASIGSLAAGYPLQLFAADDPRLLETAEYLAQNCLIDNGFFHDMSHSGINPYLTLHLAQVFLRAGDRRALSLMNRIARLASPTGQWPEAIHPRTGGGCMGDGQHVWAAAEWIQMLQHCFIQEEPAENRLVLCAGLPAAWFGKAMPVSFGPVWTRYGTISLTVEFAGDRVEVRWTGDWHAEAPEIRVAPIEPGLRVTTITAGMAMIETL